MSKNGIDTWIKRNLETEKILYKYDAWNYQKLPLKNPIANINFIVYYCNLGPMLYVVSLNLSHDNFCSWEFYPSYLIEVNFHSILGSYLLSSFQLQYISYRYFNQYPYENNLFNYYLKWLLCNLFYFNHTIDIDFQLTLACSFLTLSLWLYF